MDEKQTKTTKERSEGARLFRELPVNAIRATDDNTRAVEISFSSEVPYARWYDGTEILSHDASAVDLTRLNEIGVVLYNHNRDKVIGKITKAWLEDKRGLATIEFDEDKESDLIYSKVKSGTLKGVSVGYSVDKWEEVTAGKKSAEGFEGPCYVARSWVPFEVSIVSVPADGTVGVGREEGEPEENAPVNNNGFCLLSNYEKQIQINKNYSKIGGKRNEN